MLASVCPFTVVFNFDNNKIPYSVTCDLLMPHCHNQYHVEESTFMLRVCVLSFEQFLEPLSLLQINICTCSLYCGCPFIVLS